MIERLFEHQLIRFLEQRPIEAGLLGLDDSGQGLEPEEKLGVGLGGLRGLGGLGPGEPRG